MAEYSQETLGATFLSVVEELTFMFGEPEDKEELDFEKVEFTQARMTFTGDLAGELAVVVPTESTSEIAANILGLEPEDLSDKSMLDDALGEMLNVVCGHVIMSLVGAGANFKLASPEVLLVSEDEISAMVDNDNFVGFTLDDYPVLLGLITE